MAINWINLIIVFLALWLFIYIWIVIYLSRKKIPKEGYLEGEDEN